MARALGLLDRGVPTRMRARRHTDYSGRATDVSVVLDLMIHDLHLAAQLAGTDRAEVLACESHTVHGPLPDRVDATIQLGTVEAELSASRLESEAVRDLELTYPQGRLRIDFLTREAKNQTLQALPARLRGSERPPELKDPLGHGHRRLPRLRPPSHEPGGLGPKRAGRAPAGAASREGREGGRVSLAAPPRSSAELAEEAEVRPILFNDLSAQQAAIRERLERRLRTVLDHGRYIDGPEIQELEQALATGVGVAHCIACSSGTDALVIPLMALGLTREDAVLVPAFTYNATANAAVLAGGVPVFADIDLSTFAMSADDLEARIHAARAAGLRPRAAVAVDLFGVPADYSALRRICEAEGLVLLADAAQSFGGGQAGRRVGALADATATSFHPAKALAGYGDGGAIFTDDADLAATCRSIRWHGTDDDRVESVRIGLNGRMSSFQAAVLLEKARIFEGELAARRSDRSDLQGAAPRPRDPAGRSSRHPLRLRLLHRRRRPPRPCPRASRRGRRAHRRLLPHAPAPDVRVRALHARSGSPRRRRSVQPRPQPAHAPVPHRRSGPPRLRRPAAGGEGLTARSRPSATRRFAWWSPVMFGGSPENLRAGS